MNALSSAECTKATPHKDRLTALCGIALKIFCFWAWTAPQAQMEKLCPPDPPKFDSRALSLHT
jgi:hypothetical protein